MDVPHYRNVVMDSSRWQRVALRDDDIIVAPDKAVSYAIIGAGGFLGMGRHDVAIPVNQLKEDSGKFILAGGSKDAIKAMPVFEYAR